MNNVWCHPKMFQESKGFRNYLGIYAHQSIKCYHKINSWLLKESRKWVFSKKDMKKY